MKRNLIWFLVGFAVSWIVWRGVHAYRYRPRDYNEEMRKNFGVSHPFPFFDYARGIGMGELALLVAADDKTPDAFLYLSGEQNRYFVFIQDTDTNGLADMFLIADTHQQHWALEDRNEDGRVDRMSFSEGADDSSASFYDYGVNGSYDVKLDGEENPFLSVEGSWMPIVRQNGALHANGFFLVRGPNGERRVTLSSNLFEFADSMKQNPQQEPADLPAEAAGN